jgi:hypothetical protein
VRFRQAGSEQKRIFDATRHLTGPQPTDEQRRLAEALAQALHKHGVSKVMLALRKPWEEYGDGTPFPADLGDLGDLPEP